MLGHPFNLLRDWTDPVYAWGSWEHEYDYYCDASWTPPYDLDIDGEFDNIVKTNHGYSLVHYMDTFNTPYTSYIKLSGSQVGHVIKAEVELYQDVSAPKYRNYTFSVWPATEEEGRVDIRLSRLTQKLWDNKDDSLFISLPFSEEYYNNETHLPSGEEVFPFAWVGWTLDMTSWIGGNRIPLPFLRFFFDWKHLLSGSRIAVVGPVTGGGGESGGGGASGGW